MDDESDYTPDRSYARVIVEVVGSPLGNVFLTVEQPPKGSRTVELDVPEGQAILDYLARLMERTMP